METARGDEAPPASDRAVRPLTVADLDWLLDLLVERHEPLMHVAPVFWNPAADAREVHRTYLQHLLTHGARGYRTDTSALVVAPRGDGWLVDDAHVPGQRWLDVDDGDLLWQAFAADCGGKPVRMVCPVHEDQRTAFARRVGLEVAETWWLRELSGGGGEPGVAVDLPGAEAVTVAAPPVYAPPGPVLLVHSVTDASCALPAAVRAADEAGCAILVVSVRDETPDLVAALEAAGLQRHAEFLEGVVQPPPVRP